jgi:ABC-type antimicrobial peptide transport system permease subunit
VTALRIAVADALADWRRSLLTVVSVVPIVAAFLVLLGVSAGLRAEEVMTAESNIVLVSPDALDPSAGRLDPGVLDVVPAVGGLEVAAFTPGIFRSVKVGDRILQLRGVDLTEWGELFSISLLEGALPRPGVDEVAITEGVVIATGWGIGSEVEIYGTRFTVSGLVRASGTRFVSVWMDFARADRLFEGASGFQTVSIRPAPGVDAGVLLERFEAAAEGRYEAFFEIELADRQSALSQVAARISVVSTVVGIAALAFAGFNLTAVTLAERRRDLAIARSIGFTTSEIGAVITIRSIVLSVSGFVLGGLVAWAVVAVTGPTTLRATVIEVTIPWTAWILGGAIAVAAPAVGASLALAGAARTPIRDLLEPA